VGTWVDMRRELPRILLAFRDERQAYGIRNQWLGGRDSNPDTQIQSLSEVQPPQQDQLLRPAKHGQLRQNPQYRRKKKYPNDFDFEDDTLP
jgi:hypothetical protein